MQFQNRILLILLSVLVCFSLVSCKTAPDVPDLTPTPTATATPTPSPTPTPEPTPSPTPYREIYPITFGLSTGNSYQNEYFNVKVDLNDRWYANSSLELDAASGFPMEIPDELRQSEYLDVLPKGGAVQEYYAHMHTGLQEFSILVSDVKTAMTVYDSVADYHEVNIELIRGVFIEAGATVIRDEHTTAMFAGQEQSCWFFSYELDGYTTYNAQVIQIQGDYAMNIFVTSVIEDRTTDILAMFVPMSE
jgi:hypothetical protein